jgi:hypothetical protein
MKKFKWQDVIDFLKSKGWMAKSGVVICAIAKAGMLFDPARMDFWLKLYEYGSWIALGGVMKGAAQSDTARHVVRQATDTMAKLRGNKTPQ